MRQFVPLRFDFALRAAACCFGGPFFCFNSALYAASFFFGMPGVPAQRVSVTVVLPRSLDVLCELSQRLPDTER